jgi:hypothetical protein
LLSFALQLLSFEDLLVFGNPGDFFGAGRSTLMSTFCAFGVGGRSEYTTFPSASVDL